MSSEKEASSLKGLENCQKEISALSESKAKELLSIEKKYKQSMNPFYEKRAMFIKNVRKPQKNSLL
jgi:hypothetical protein